MWHYVYILQSATGEQYVGLTENLNDRLAKHNRGEVAHTSKYLPWELIQFSAFGDRKRAAEFERYLKSGSGRSFQVRHLLSHASKLTGVLYGPISIVQKFLDAENRRDWFEWANFLHNDVTYEVVGSQDPPVRGKDAYVRKMQQTYTELPDWHFAIVHIQGEAETVFVEFNGHGQFSGTHGGRQFTNVRLRLQAVCVFTMNGALIHKVREYWDPQGYERQLSVG